MKIKKILISFILIIAAITAVACSKVKYGQNLLANGDFKNGLTGWGKKTEYSGSATFDKGYYDEAGAQGENRFYFAEIKNTEDVKTALTQRVRVERGEIYKFTVSIGVTSNFSGMDSGAFAGIAEFPDKNICVDGGFASQTSRQTGNGTGRERFEFYFYILIESVDYVTLELRCNSVGSARFVNVKFEKFKLNPTAPSYYNIKNTAEANTVKRGSGINPWAFVLAVFFALVFLAAAFLGYEFIARQLKKDEKKQKKNEKAEEKSELEKDNSLCGPPAAEAPTEKLAGTLSAEAAPAEPVRPSAPPAATKKKAAMSKEFGILLIALGIVFVLKLIFAGLVYGHNAEFKEFAGFAAYITKNGLAAFYGAFPQSGLAPGYVYILGFLGLLTKNAAHGSFMQMMLFRLPAIIADTASSVLIFFILKRGLKNQKIALTGALLYAVNIAVFANSAWWGQFDSIAAALILLALYMALTQNYLPACLTYAAAILFKVQAVFIAPVFLAYLAVAFIKKRDQRLAIGISAGVALIAWFIMSLPLTVNQLQSGDVFFIFKNYTQSLVTNTLTQNAFNFYGIFGFQNEAVNNPALANWVLGIMVTLLSAFLIVLFVRYKGKGNITLVLSAFLLSAICTFSVNMREHYIFAVIILLSTASLLIRDRRLYFISVLYTLLQFTCTAGLMVIGKSTYADNSALMIAGSVASIGVFVYFTFVLIDILMQNKVKSIKNYTNIFK